MAIRPLLLIFSLLQLQTLLGQTQKQDSLVQKRLVTPSIYVDYGKLLTIQTSIETKYEGAIELLLRESIQIIGEIGRATLNPEGAFRNGTYESDGLYYRIGVGYLAQPTPKNKIGLSLRFAHSTYDESGTYVLQSPTEVQGDFVQSINRQDLTAQWGELVLNTDRKINQLLSIGMHLRFRVLVSYDEQEVIDVYAIPGYGRSFDRTIPAANFFLKATF